MNGIRFVTKGDAPKDGITSVQAARDSVVLDENFEEVAPGSGAASATALALATAALAAAAGAGLGDGARQAAGSALPDPRPAALQAP